MKIVNIPEKRVSSIYDDTPPKDPHDAFKSETEITNLQIKNDEKKSDQTSISASSFNSRASR